MQPRPLLMIDAFDHQIEVLFPLVDHVVPQQDLGETGAVSLHARIAVVPLDGCRAAEDHRSFASGQDRRTGRGFARVEREHLPGDSRFDEGRDHAVRRPRFLRSRLEHQAHCRGMTGSHSVCTPGEFEGSTAASTGACAW